MRVAIVLSLLGVWSIGCGRVESLVEGIGDAENAMFTTDGRLFVTGGENAYEIVAANSGNTLRRLYAGTCNFTGIVERGGVLYTACVSGEVGASPAYLLAAPLAPEPKLEIIHEFVHAVTPNGLALDAGGRLFVADSTPLQSQLVVVTLDPSDPLRVKSEQVWLTGFTFLNGLRFFDGKLFATDLSALQSIPIEADGSPGPTTLIAVSATVFDDLLPSKQGVLVTDFLGGRLLLYAHDGRQIARTAQLFDSPSSVTFGRPPLVAAGGFVVTEKGEIGDLSSALGNRVSVFTPEQ